MKYIKTFEDIESCILQGYYVILNPERLKGYHILTIDKNKNDFEKFIKNNIGVVRSFHYTNTKESKNKILNVNYDVEPTKNIKGAFMYDFTRNQYYVSIYAVNVIEFDTSKEKLELKISANKYNI